MTTADTDIHKTLEPLRPGRNGLAGAILSVIVCTVLALCFFILSSIIRAAVAHSVITASIDHHTWNAANNERNLKQILDMRGWLRLFGFTRFLPSLEIQDPSLLKLKIAQDAAALGKEKTAVQSILGAVLDVENTTVQGAFLANCKPIAGALSQLKDQNTQWQTLSSSLYSGRQYLERVSAENHRLKQTYTLLKRSFADSLGLPEPIDESTESPSFYESGVFAGLPTLNNVPDGLQTITDLQSTISGKSSLQIKDDILLSILKTKELSLPLASELAQNEKELLETTRKTNDSATRETELIKGIISSGAILLLQSTRVDLSCRNFYLF